MDWENQNRMINLELTLDRALELLREFGSCDPYTGQPYDEVEEFLKSARVREALR
jgi:hypothetical protein